jgi:hypothetical protein
MPNSPVGVQQLSNKRLWTGMDSMKPAPKFQRSTSSALCRRAAQARAAGAGLFSSGERWVAAANVGGKYCAWIAKSTYLPHRDLEVHGYIIVKEKRNG